MTMGYLGDVLPEPGLTFTNPDKRLEYILKSISQQIQTDLAAIYTYSHDSNNPQLVACLANEAIEDWIGVSEWLLNQLMLLQPESTLHISHPPELEMRCVLLWPLTMWDDIIGAVVLMSRDAAAYSVDDVHLFEPQVLLAQTTIENTLLVERLITTEAIALTARDIALNPSPQNIINALRNYLFDAHISLCVIGLFGPVRLDYPKGPFEYIEIGGAWSRNGDNAPAIGIRCTQEDYERLEKHIEHDKYFTFSRVDDIPCRDLSSLLNQTENVQSGAILSLESEQVKLGLLIILTDEHYEFSAHELRSYQIVAEFLTMSTMATALQQQANFVQQSRAALLDAVTDGVVMVLPDEASSILTVNARFTDMFDIKEADVQGMPLWELLEHFRISPQTRCDLDSVWRSVSVHTPDTLRGEFRMTSPTGINCDIQWYSGPVYLEGQVIGRLYTFHDITPERTTERLRSELLSRISHELRTPLTSIRGFAEFILEEEQHSLQPKSREYLHIIQKAAKHLTTIFTDMIDITRANAGQLKLHLSEANLPTLLSEVVARMEPLYREKGQKITMNMDVTKATISMDVDRIDQVLTNLINNAIKYSGKDTTIRITVKHIKRTKELPRHAPRSTDTPCVLIGILDQGTGLTEEEADKIFLPFYRTGEARARQIDGSGLGLAIALSIVELHRGRIWVEPATKRKPGGKFYFTVYDE